MDRDTELELELELLAVMRSRMEASRQSQVREATSDFPGLRVTSGAPPRNLNGCRPDRSLEMLIVDTLLI